MVPKPIVRLRKLCLALPAAHEVEAWGEPTFRVKNKIFAMYASAHNHHGGGTASVWIKSTPVNQGIMLGFNPERFFKPPYVGPSGWIGVRLDGPVNWDEVREILTDGYRLTAPKSLIAQLGDASDAETVGGKRAPRGTTKRRPARKKSRAAAKRAPKKRPAKKRPANARARQRPKPRLE